MSNQKSSHSSLFPPPSTTPPSELAAVHWPGTTAESTDALLDVLKDNHERWHVFFNDLKFHNHSAHRALAMYGLGADGELIKKMYEKDSANQKKAYETPEEITEENFVDHLGDEHYYTAYRRFFTQHISSKGIGATLEEFIFSRKYNLAPAIPSLSNPSSPESKKTANKGDAAATLQNLEDYADGVKEAPHMFSRFLSGLLHPFIHTGYGAEFGLPGTIVEGLAQMSVTEEQCTPLTPSSLFNSSSDADTDESPITTAKRLADSLHKSLDAALLIDPTSTAKPTATSTSNNGIEATDIERDKIKPVHALSILHCISTSSTLVPPDGITDERQIFEWTMEHHGNTIANLVAEWSLDTRTPGGVHNAVEEVAWVVCLMYGVGGWTGRERVKGVFNADFFLMHLVTSSLFLPALLSQLQSSRSKRALLRGYMGTIMAWYIGRGKPKLDIKGIFESPLAECTEANRWAPLLTPSITHNDEHVPKLIRALAHWGRLFGTRPKGFLGKLHEDGGGLEGGELVDGSLFVRAAELTVQRMGREGEGVFWDMPGFYDRK